MSNDAENQTVLDNLTNAHNALSNVVNKHIECTTGMEKVGDNRDSYYCAVLAGHEMRLTMLSDRISRMRNFCMIMSGMVVLNFLLLIGYLK